MAFTYLCDLSTDRDRVRFALGDVTSSDPLFTDAEIDGALTTYGSVSASAAMLADGQAAKYARRVTMSIDGASVNYSDLAKQWRDLAARIRANAVIADSGSIGSPFVGGVSISDMDANQDDTDRNPSRFEVGQFDYPGTSLAAGDDDSDDV